jgi:uncharacterized protein (UPF0297 family)
MKSLNIETVLATGAQETATGSRLALRGMIWFAYGFHLECNLGDTKPAAYNRKVNAALQAAGRGKGEGSTKGKQAVTIGDGFPKIFGAELASQYATVQDMVQACFNASEASGAGSVLRLVDWAAHGDPDYTAKSKAAKKAEKDQEKQDAMDAVNAAIANATPLTSLDLDAVAKVVEVQNLNPETVESETKENTIKGQVADMSDADLAALAKIIRAEIAGRKKATLAAVAA